MSAPNEIKELVDKFERNEHVYKDPTQYDEENTKIEFINPFFESLGWDVYNKQNISPLYKDVVFEKSIKVGSRTKSPDYAFCIGGQVKFFVEAKKPSVDIERDKNPAFQVRRYGWSADNVELCILTDFETLAVYETNTRPDKNQSSSIGRIKFYHYKEYVDKWDEIEGIFSKDAVLKGNFDNYIQNHEGIKKGTSTVDNEFLKEIETWREKLARNIALRNESIKVEKLNYAVQLIIDRIIFLRIAEDRGIERYGTLKELLEEKNIYINFCKICKRADKKYNSGLFHFTEEKEDDFTVDTYTLDLNIDDNVFKEIFTNLYYPNSPYEFSVLPIEILGQVYEEFLGKTIRLTKGHHAKVEERVEVKKAGGVYYTPRYIVDYIVKNTLGEKIKNKTPNQISNIHILDPACGSGSFLIRAYQYLLEYHLNYYSNLKKPPKDVIYEDKNKNKKLTIREKKRILLNNIYGVDIDPLAVEVTKLSLLLKVLEDQNKDLLEAQQKLIEERVLPNLSNNIQNGNSLISSSNLKFEEKTNKDLFNKIKPFDWNEEYVEIMNNGGFDIIIGNPPYVSWNLISNRKYFEKGEYNNLKYKCRPNHEDAHPNLYMFFLVQSLILSKEIVSFILPQEWLEYVQDFRDYLLDNTGYITILKFNPNFRIFKNKEGVVGTNSLIITLYKNNKNKFKINELDETNENKVQKILENNEINKITHQSKKDRFKSKKWKYYKDITEKILLTEEKKDLIKLNNKEYFEVFGGFQPNVNLSKKFIINNIDILNDFEKQFIYPCVYDAKQFKRYELITDGNYWIVLNKHFNDENEFKNQCPNLYKYLSENITKKTKKWWEFPNIRNINLIDNYDEKLIHPRTSTKNSFCYDDKHTVTKGTNSMIISKTLSTKYVLAILNSSLADYFYSDYGMGYHGNNKYEPKQVKNEMIPIKYLSDKEQAPFINNVNLLMDYKQQLKNPLKSGEKKNLNKIINIINNKLNNMVYEIYDLTPEEIEIIENELKEK